MNLKFEKLAQQILGETSEPLGFDNKEKSASSSSFRSKERNAGEKRGGGPERPYLVVDEDGQPVANYKTEGEARTHAKKIGGRVRMVAR